jgi:hypothetical protein
VFSHLYTQEKTMQEFRKDESEFGIAMNKDFLSKINSNPAHNKITLDIAGQKKAAFKKNKADDANWGAFGGIGFPAGFEPPPGMAPPSNTFGTEFDAPSKVPQQSSVDFFGDDEPPKQAPAQSSTKQPDLMGGDLLSGG